jgi:DNA repair photolyase
LENTHWQIRLLSKSALLQTVAEGLADHRDRVIYGLSTGTFEDPLAQSFELRASTPTARLRTLHWLQDNGYRTFAMLCPVLPQDDYHKFAAEAVRQVRADRCEHVWAEVLNVRGQSLVQTCAGLRTSGFEEAAKRLEEVSGPDNKSAWESYARATFLALSKMVPPEKLRFMQYVQAGQLGWWQQRERCGALLLGAHAGGTGPKSKGAHADHLPSGGGRKYSSPRTKRHSAGRL